MHRSIWKASIRTLIVSMSIVLSATACSLSSTIEDAVISKKREAIEPVTLEWWSSSSLGLIDEEEFKQVIMEYKKVAPNVIINYNSIPVTGLDEKMNVAIASGSFPDVYVDAINRLAPLYSRGVTAPLDTYITEEYNLPDYMNSARDLMTIQGKLAMFLMEIRSEVLLINKDLFVKAGAEQFLPDAQTKTWTRDKFAQAVEAIGKLGNGVYGLGLTAGDIAYDKFIDGYIYSDGDEYTNKDYTKVTYNSPGNVKKLDWLIRLASSPYAVPGTAGNKIPNLYELFKQGKVGIMMNDRGDLRREINDGVAPKTFEFALALYPTDDGSKSKLFVNGSGIAVKKQDDKEKEKEAAKFAMWFSSGKSEVVNRLVYQKYAKLPARKSLQTLISDEQGKAWAAMPEKAIINPVLMPNYQQIRKVWFLYFQQAVLNNAKMTAKDALAGYEKDAQRLLDEGNKQLKILP
jgi:multiple sugar transport system substrate-binding protein